jgi:hypothetical protein
MDYQPLNASDNEIRLLTIQPAAEEAAPVDSLNRVSLSQLPSYAALSYCWGSPHDTRPITVNSNTFDATANLYQVLVRFRAKGIDTLWVDAICINQWRRAARSRSWVPSTGRRSRSTRLPKSLVRWLYSRASDYDLY